jgi:polysaccharide deacetylase family protein (PEP-CTERM system associated)
MPGAPESFDTLLLFKQMRNALTIDVEDYYQVTAFSGRIARADWINLPSRVEANTTRLLDEISAAGFQATFFVLGWVAESHPHLIRRIADLGHEVGCHSAEHRSVYQMTPSEFREDTKRAKVALEAATGQQVYGYRAPSFSIRDDSTWAFEILAELGFQYDSSVFPVKHPNYGMPHSSRFPYRIETNSGPIVEFPMSTIEFGGVRSPLGGGAYLRFLPYWYTRWALRHVNEREGHPVCVYIHPWELDPEQPRMKGSLTARMRHYFGLRGAGRKLHNLLADFEFCSVRSLVNELDLLEEVPQVATSNF